MKLSHDKAAGARENGGNRWLEWGTHCNEARQSQKHKEVACKIHCALNHSQIRTGQTASQQIIHQIKLEVAKVLLITNIDTTNETKNMHKSLMCMVCDCFIIGSNSKIPSMSMSDIMQHSYWLGVKCYEECQNAPLHKDLLAQYTVLGFPGMLLSPFSWKVGPGCYLV